jgi:hypothetical protein
VQCPVCERESRSAHCACGYDFATGDRRSVALRARRDRERSARVMKLGFAFIAVLPVGFVIGLPLIGALNTLYLMAPLCVAGAATLAQGLYRRHAATRLLAAATEPLPLPAARVLPTE